MDEKKYSQLYQALLQEVLQFHNGNQRRIRKGMLSLLLVPLVFLVLLFLSEGSRVIFLLLWIVSMFGIAAYLIAVEYIDYEMQNKVKQITKKEVELDQLTPLPSAMPQLLPLLRAMGYSVRVLPGLSSVQLLAAAVGRPWQDWKLVSAHGRACDPIAEILAHPQVFFLTGGGDTPATLCAKLTAAGLGAAHALVGENLGSPAEAIRFGLARELAEQTFAPLSVLLIEREALPSRRTPGLPDDAFIRGAVPMTKQEVRAAALAKLAVTPTDTLWDVGAGTGSVSVELALAAPAGQVYAVECDPKACILIQKNREKFAVYNLTLIEGKAPEALDMLPAPDAVFIGGTKGNMDAVIDAVLHKNPVARLCVAAIALETLSAAVAALTAHGLAAEVTQIAVSRTKTAGSLHLLMANNPVFLIMGART